jgi:hypothetical protein
VQSIAHDWPDVRSAFPIEEPCIDRREVVADHILAAAAVGIALASIGIILLIASVSRNVRSQEFMSMLLHLSCQEFMWVLLKLCSGCAAIVIAVVLMLFQDAEWAESGFGGMELTSESSVLVRLMSGGVKLKLRASPRLVLTWKE